MNFDEKENPKAKLVLISTIWMVAVGLSLILIDGIILPSIDSAGNVQVSILSIVLGVLSIVLGVLHWKEKRWSVFVSMGITFGAVIFANRIHWTIYILSPSITSSMMAYYSALGRESK